MPKGDVSDEQWGLLEPSLSPLPRRTDGRGRPWDDSRVWLNGMFFLRDSSLKLRVPVFALEYAPSYI
jgi:hypothetical protein